MKKKYFYLHTKSSLSISNFVDYSIILVRMPSVPLKLNRFIFKFTFGISLFLISINSYGQNLVPNHDFDFHTWCPIGRGLIGWAVPWYSPNFNTTDFSHVCSGTDSYSGVPGNRWGNQYPYSGNGYAGLRTWLSRETYVTGVNYREYLAVALTDSLIAGQNYLLSFKVSVGDNAGFFTDDIGMYLANDSIPRNPADTILHVTPQLSNPEGNIITNMTDWIEISTNYIANGGEKYIVIGNFLNDAETTVIEREDNDPDELLQSTYFYIDDVRVIGCTDRFPQDLITASDTSLCPGEKVELAAPLLDSAIYEWEDGSTDPIREVSKGQIYNIKINIEGCISRDTIEIFENEVPAVDLGNDTTLCPGESLILSFEEEADSFQWNDGSNSSSISILESGLYSIQIEKGECTIIDSVQVTFEQELLPIQSIDTIKCQGTTIILEAKDDGFKYLWQDLSTERTFSVSTFGEYWVDIIAPCITRRQSFYVVDENCSCESFIPNVFSPNNDGINDVFQPDFFQGGIAQYHLDIFDRYGRLLFTTQDVSKYWEGTYQQKQAPEGVYYWILKYACKENGIPKQKILKGHVSLLR